MIKENKVILYPKHCIIFDKSNTYFWECIPKSSHHENIDVQKIEQKLKSICHDLCSIFTMSRINEAHWAEVSR